MGAELWRPCVTESELHQWVLEHVKVDVPRTAVCPGHQAPFDYLSHAYFERKRDLVVWAPRGGGKTFLGAVATLLDLMHKPNCHVRILGGSLEQSLRMWDHLNPLLYDLAESRISGKPLARRIALENGSSAAVLTQSQRAVRGLRVQKLRCDEVELFDPKIWEAAQLVTRSVRAKGEAHPEGQVLGAIEAISTLHRPFGLMQKIVEEARERGRTIIRWCLLEVLEPCPPDRKCDGCPLHSDCAGIAHSKTNGFFGIDDAIALKSRVSLDTWNAEMMCRKPSQHHSVFPTFDEAIHVKEQLPEGVGSRQLAVGSRTDSVGRTLSPSAYSALFTANCPLPTAGFLSLSIDFGFNNPFACLWIVRTPDGFVHVIDEYQQRGVIVSNHLEQIRRRPWQQAKLVTCDPAGSARNDQTGKSDVNLIRDAGYTVKHRSSLIQDGLEMIRAALAPAMGSVKLYIHPRCKQLIKSMRAYHYPDTGGEVPVKDNENDHLIDALRYHFVNFANSHKLDGRPY